jgi:cell division protein FtsB
MKAHWVSALLVGLLLMLHAHIWWGRGSLPQVRQWRETLQQMEVANAQQRQANGRLQSEIRDLQEGLDRVEALARHELGMLKPNELFVQWVQTPAAWPSP